MGKEKCSQIRFRDGAGNGDSDGGCGWKSECWYWRDTGAASSDGVVALVVTRYILLRPGFFLGGGGFFIPPRLLGSSRTYPTQLPPRLAEME